MSAVVEEAEQWDEEEYNIFASFCQDMKMSKKFEGVEPLHEPCFHKGITFWLRWASRVIDNKWL